MNKDAIDHIKTVEEQAKALRQETDQAIAEINQKKDEEIDRIQADLDRDLKEHKSDREVQADKRLDGKREQSDKNMEEAKVAYAAAYNEHVERVSDTLTKEVLNTYGNF